MWCRVTGCGFESHALRLRKSMCSVNMRRTTPKRVATYGGPFLLLVRQIDADRYPFDASRMAPYWEPFQKLGTLYGTVSCCFWRLEGATVLGGVGSCPGDLAAFLPNNAHVSQHGPTGGHVLRWVAGVGILAAQINFTDSAQIKCHSAATACPAWETFFFSSSKAFM